MRAEIVADTESGEFLDFRPYVAAIGNTGAVAFQATLADGSTGVCLGSERITVPGAAVSSHPDFNDSGEVCAYVDDGRTHLWTRSEGILDLGFDRIGPLGPTMNAQGTIAFRGERTPGVAGIYLYRHGEVATIAEQGSRYSAFQGLPVVNASNQVVFRTESANRQGIHLWEDGAVRAVVETGTEFESLGNFPSFNDRGDVAFSSNLGVFCWTDGMFQSSVMASTQWESFRGALIDNSGRLAVFATPAGGQLSVYYAGGKVLSIGDLLLGSTVTEFALNSVSMNDGGQLAVRVALECGRQVVVRITLPLRTPDEPSQ